MSRAGYASWRGAWLEVSDGIVNNWLADGRVLSRRKDAGGDRPNTAFKPSAATLPAHTGFCVQHRKAAAIDEAAIDPALQLVPVERRETLIARRQAE